MWGATFNCAVIVGLAAAFLVILCVFVALVAMCVEGIAHILAKWNWNEQRESLRAELYSLDRWLSYEFPVVEQVTERLRLMIDGEGREDMREFREMLREKYKEQVGK